MCRFILLIIEKSFSSFVSLSIISDKRAISWFKVLILSSILLSSVKSILSKNKLILPITLPLRKFKSRNLLAFSCSVYKAVMAFSIFCMFSFITSALFINSCKYLLRRGFSLVVSSKLFFKLDKEVWMAVIEGMGTLKVLLHNGHIYSLFSESENSPILSRRTFCCSTSLEY